jgi:hypothetical protein
MLFYPTSGCIGAHLGELRRLAGLAAFDPDRPWSGDADALVDDASLYASPNRDFWALSGSLRKH